MIVEGAFALEKDASSEDRAHVSLLSPSILLWYHN